MVALGTEDYFGIFRSRSGGLFRVDVAMTHVLVMPGLCLSDQNDNFQGKTIWLS